MSKEVTVKIATRFRVIQIGFLIAAFILFVSIFFSYMDEISSLTQEQINIAFLSLGFAFVIAVLGVVFGTSYSITFKEDGIQRKNLIRKSFKSYSDYKRIIFIRTAKDSFKNALIKKNDIVINKTFINVDEAIKFLSDKDVEVIT